jgi:mannose-6-phosphate isomerase-like protein (cupin superfamily)
VNPGYACSLHFHKVKQETFRVISGVVELELQSGIELKDNKITMNVGDEELIRPWMSHRFSTHTGAIILEISTHHEDSDSYRIQESKKIDDPKSS